MFSFDATPVTFVGLLALFGWSTVWSAWELVRARTTTQRVSGALHLLMSVVMLAMVPGALWAPLTDVVGTPVLALVFGLATAWFVTLAVRGWRSAGRRAAAHPAAHAAMFAAMTWHLAAMAVMGALMSPGTDAHAGAGHQDMGGMGDPGAGSTPPGETAATTPGGVLWVVALIGVPLMAYLLVAGVAALTRVAQPPAAVRHDCPCGADCHCGPSCACGVAHAASGTPPLRELAVVGVTGALASLTRPGGTPDADHLCRAASPVGSAGYRLTALSDAAMNLGMFWMSAGLMTPLLPFLAVLAI